MTLFQAISGCLALSIGFVGCLYIIPKRISKLPRNNKTHVKWRLAVTLTYTIMTPILMKFIYNIPAEEFLVKLGFSTTLFFSKILKPTLLILILFTGSIVNNILSFINNESYMELVEEDVQGPDAEPISKNYFKILLNILNIDLDIYTFRNLIAAPIVEELIFRSCINFILTYSMDSNQNLSALGLTCLVPLFFGLSHLHHYFNLKSLGHSSKQSLMVVAIQFCYTYIFGLLAYLIFRGNNSIYSIIFIHGVCNYLSLPDTSFFTDEVHQNYSQRYLIAVSYFIGIFGFFFNFNILTDFN